MLLHIIYYNELQADIYKVIVFIIVPCLEDNYMQNWFQAKK